MSFLNLTFPILESVKWKIIMYKFNILNFFAKRSYDFFFYLWNMCEGKTMIQNLSYLDELGVK